MGLFNFTQQPALGETTGANSPFELGLMYSTGGTVPVDYVTAHKWFNIAAMNGNTEAIRLRREIAAEMTAAEIATALRAARDWMRENAATDQIRTAA